MPPSENYDMDLVTIEKASENGFGLEIGYVESNVERGP